MSRENAIALAVYLVPLAIALVGFLAGVIARAVTRYVKDRRVALATELLALHAGAIVADIGQHLVDALKDPAQAGTWDEIAKRTARDRAVARLKSGFPSLVALVAESLAHPTQIEEVLGTLVEKGVVEQKAKAPARASELVLDVAARPTVAPEPIAPAR